MPAAAAGKRRGRRRGRGQPADEDDADALEALPLESEAAIEVEGHPVQRHIHSDGGEPGAGAVVWRKASRGRNGLGELEWGVGRHTHILVACPSACSPECPAFPLRSLDCRPLLSTLPSPAGEPVLVGSEALEAVLGNARDKKESAAK